MNQVDEPCKPSIVETNEVVSDMIQGEKVKGTHPDIKRAHEGSNLTVEDHPIDSLETHSSSHEATTDQLSIQTRKASVRHYSFSDLIRGK